MEEGTDQSISLKRRVNRLALKELTHNELGIKMKIEMENPGLKTVEAYNLRIEFQNFGQDHPHYRKWLKVSVNRRRNGNGMGGKTKSFTKNYRSCFFRYGNRPPASPVRVTPFEITSFSPASTPSL